MKLIEMKKLNSSDPHKLWNDTVDVSNSDLTSI